MIEPTNTSELDPIRALLQEQKPKKAELELKSILKQQPNNIQSLRLLAVAYKNQTKVDKYLKALKKTYEVSRDISDFELFVYELQKNKAFDNAAKLKSQALESDEYKEKLINLLRNKNVIALNNHNFYLSYKLHDVKLRLRKLADSLGDLSKKEASQLQWFIENLFNHKAYKTILNSFLHRPSYLVYPGISQSPFPSTEGLIKGGNISEFLSSIRNEVLSIMENHQAEPYVKVSSEVSKDMGQLKGSMQWSSITIYEGGKLKNKDGERLFNLLEEQFNLANCAPMSPEVVISVLKPKAKIPPHYGLSNIKQTLHIPISIPEGDVKIKVCGMEKSWNEAEPLVFDDSFLHEAWNNTNESRVVLIADIWHPDLTENERVFLTKAMPLIDQWHKETAL